MSKKKKLSHEERLLQKLHMMQKQYAHHTDAIVSVDGKLKQYLEKLNTSFTKKKDEAMATTEKHVKKTHEIAALIEVIKMELEAKEIDYSELLDMSLDINKPKENIKEPDYDDVPEGPEIEDEDTDEEGNAVVSTSTIKRIMKGLKEHTDED